MATDSLGVEIQPRDRVRVLAWGAPVRLTDVGAVGVVERFTAKGNVVLLHAPQTYDPVARGRAVPPGMLGVLDRSGGNGYEGNRR